MADPTAAPAPAPTAAPAPAPATTGAPAGHDAAMIAAAEAAAKGGAGDIGSKPAVITLPEGGLEKFYDAATGAYDWKGHAGDVQFRFDQSRRDKGDTVPAPAPAVTPVQTPQPAPVEVSKPVVADPAPVKGTDHLAINQDNKGVVDGAAAVVTAAGMDFDALSNEYQRDGALSKESYTRLASAGIPEGMVTQFIKGQEALAVAYTTELHAAAGGKASYDEAIAWGKENLPQVEANAFDLAVTGTDIGQAKLAIAGLKAQAGNNLSGLITDTLTGEPSDGVAFQSQAEVTAAMRDPRYKTDPSYREVVKNRLKNSNVF